jgi:phosphoesterase RecJ-like protein
MPDISLCLDCGDVGRFLKRKEKFQEGRVSICIDHHRTTKPFCNFNHIDPEAAATGELIYQLLCLLGGPKDRETADALYAAIATDTGNFQYSNTSKKSHQIVAELYDWGLEANQVSQAIYDNVRLPKLLLHSRAMETLELLAGGQGAVAWVNPAMAEEVGAAMDETDGIVEKLRSIEGVEIAAFVKGVSPQQTKVSLRAKSWGDVANIAEKFGGGGHSKAAGCTLKMPLEEGLALIKREVEDALK